MTNLRIKTVKSNLNNKSNLNSIEKKISDNKYLGTIETNNQIKELPIFLKFSPLLDPIKYMTGKYDFSLNSILMPSLETIKGKIYRENNSAYTDAFFSFLSDKLFHDEFHNKLIRV